MSMESSAQASESQLFGTIRKWLEQVACCFCFSLKLYVAHPPLLSLLSSPPPPPHPFPPTVSLQTGAQNVFRAGQAGYVPAAREPQVCVNRSRMVMRPAARHAVTRRTLAQRSAVRQRHLRGQCQPR